MRHVIAHLKKEKYFSYIYLCAFLLSLHYAFVLYINSSFLEQFLSTQTIAFLFIGSALINITILLNITTLLRRFGNWRLMLSFLVLEMIGMLGMSLSTNGASASISFLVFGSMASILLFNLDIFLETEIKTETHTGGIRGIFLTMCNLAFVLSPFVVGHLIGENNYTSVYTLSFIFLLLLLPIIMSKFKGFKDPDYSPMHVGNALSHFKGNGNLFHIYVTNFLLHFFYAVMIIYTPIYLHQYIGFSWGTIGEMFSIMLIPFILFQIPGGEISDHFGEKGILIVGLIVMAISTLFLSFIGQNVVAWTILLFFTRCGASLVEIMTETYFFKHVKGKNSNVIGFFRTASPLSFVITPIVATLFLLLFPMQYLYLLVGVMLLLGIQFAYSIKDTI
ncbi:MAG: MFS transporter [Candidatus Pacebacteria bacterium]|nr:MFS transporter [Candidatus Paceibacterota bacterium]MDD5356999.1 MFS transporter [Candidatus Paceibacterota bacterium]